MKPITQTISERIMQRRRQMLVHSYLYYIQNDTIVHDDVWQRWANELVELQAEHGHEIDFYDDAFKDWDGSSGYHLPLKDAWIYEACLKLQRYHYKENKDEINLDK